LDDEDKVSKKLLQLATKDSLNIRPD
jgi:hypothetical protein